MTLRFPVAKFGTADQTFGVVVQVHVILSASLTGVRHCVWLGSDVGVELLFFDVLQDFVLCCDYLWLRVGVVWKVENWKVERRSRNISRRQMGRESAQ